MFKYIKKLTKHSFIYGFGDLLYKGLNIILIPLYTRYLTTSDYGIIEVVRSIGSILLILYTLGLDSALARYYFDYKDISKLKEYIFTILSGILLSGLLITFFLNFSENIFFTWVKDIKFDPYIKLTLWTSFFLVFPTIFLVFLQVQEKSFKYILFQLLQAILLLATIIYFVVYLKEGAYGQIKARFFAIFLAAILTLCFFSKHLKPSFQFKEYINSLKYGLPITIHSLSWWILSLSNRLILQRYVPLKEVGIYSLGHNIGMGMEIILASFNRAWVPFLFSSADKESPSLFATLSKYYIGVIVLIGFTISIFSKEIIMLLSTKSFYTSYEIVPIIILSYIFIGIYMMLTNQIFYKKKTHYFLIITPLSAIINIVLNFVLIPKYGMYGAAFSTLFSFFAFAMITYVFSIKVFPIPYEKTKIVFLIFIGVALFLISRSLINFSLFVNMVVKIFFIILFCFLLWILGYISKEDKIKIINKIKVWLGNQ